MARSVAPLALALMVASCLLIAGPRTVSSAISCGQVASSLGPCIPYSKTPGTAPPPPACCGGVSKLNSLAQTTPDRRAACTCIKSLVGSISGLNAGTVAGIPKKCRVSVPYAISQSTDCTKVT